MTPKLIKPSDAEADIRDKEVRVQHISRMELWQLRKIADEECYSDLTQFVRKILKNLIREKRHLIERGD